MFKLKKFINAIMYIIKGFINQKYCLKHTYKGCKMDILMG